ncbi:hypothetical protein TNCV_4653691 [Trichonephila clavipes]|nr:hypothetical protein TNCV_4653691 [Trichonephila clavipes]
MVRQLDSKGRAQIISLGCKKKNSLKSSSTITWVVVGPGMRKKFFIFFLLLPRVRRLGNTGLDDSLRWKAVGRLEAPQSQAELTQGLQVAQMWTPGYGNNSKQVILSPERSVKVTTEHDI